MLLGFSLPFFFVFLFFLFCFFFLSPCGRIRRITPKQLSYQCTAHCHKFTPHVSDRLRAGTKHSRASPDPKHVREPFRFVSLAFAPLPRLGFPVFPFRFDCLVSPRFGVHRLRPEQGWSSCKSSIPRPRLWHWAASFIATHVLSTVRVQ